MSKQTLIITIIITICWSLFLCKAYSAPEIPTDKTASAAAKFIGEISKESPTFDEIPLREYEIKDVDHDGGYEVVEIINPIEENSPGFLNIDIAPAFEWINIYRYQNNNFEMATGDFNWFLTLRKSYYQFWLRLFNNSEALDSDSLNLLKSNRKLFEETIKGYIKKIEMLLNE